MLQAHTVIVGATGRQESRHPGEDSVAFWQFFLAIVLGAALGGIFALFFWNGVCDDREKSWCACQSLGELTMIA